MLSNFQPPSFSNSIGITKTQMELMGSPIRDCCRDQTDAAALQLPREKAEKAQE